MRLASLALLAAAAWCSSTRGPSAGAPAADPVAPAVEVAPPEKRGEPLEAIIPLYRDGSTTLQSLRGKVVVLDVFAADEDGWPTAHRRWRKLASDHGSAVAVVTVAVATTGDSAVEAWDADPPSHATAWDPQGALALRLHVDRLPTVIVLDRKGREVARGDDREALATVARQLVDSEPAE